MSRAASHRIRSVRPATTPARQLASRGVRTAPSSHRDPQQFERLLIIRVLAGKLLQMRCALTADFARFYLTFGAVFTIFSILHICNLIIFIHRNVVELYFVINPFRCPRAVSSLSCQTTPAASVAVIVNTF